MDRQSSQLNRSLDQSLDRFLASQERRAFQMAYVATRDREEALEIVQDAMLKLVQKYASKPQEQWAPLFTRILQNRIKNWYRKRSLTSKLFDWFNDGSGEASEQGSSEQPAEPAYSNDEEPSRQSDRQRFLDALERALMSLPLRQQQAFLLRAVQGLDTREAAYAMQCSDGSVKTHYSRALQKLKQELHEYWP